MLKEQFEMYLKLLLSESPINVWPMGKLSHAMPNYLIKLSENGFNMRKIMSCHKNAVFELQVFENTL